MPMVYEINDILLAMAITALRLIQRPLIAGVLFVIVMAGGVITAGAVIPGDGANPTQRIMTAPLLIRDLLVFDSEHYRTIATVGYQPDSLSQAFFPAYPLLVRAVGVILPIDVALVVVSWTMAVVATIILYLWAREELQRLKVFDPSTVSWRFLLIIALFPTSFFMVLGYTESMFVALTAGSLLAYRRQQYLFAGVIAALASATRVTGFLLAVFFIVDYYQSRPHTHQVKLLPVVLTPLGLVLFMLYQWVRFGSPFSFITAQQHWYLLDSRWDVFISTITIISIGSLTIFTILTWLVYKYLDKSYFFYCLSAGLLCVASGRLTSFNRYILALPPLFLALAIVWPRIPRPARYGLLFLSIDMLISFVVLEANTNFIG